MNYFNPTLPPRAPVQVYDSALNLLGEVDTYQSLMHQRGFNGPGKWSLVINYNITDSTGTIRWASLFQVGGFITINGDGRKCGIITRIDQPVGGSGGQAGKGSQMVTISGSEPTSILGRRVLNPPAGLPVYANTGAAETVLKTMISDQCGATAATKRKFSLLQIATDQGRGAAYTLSNSYTSVLQECQNLSLATLMGFFITLDRTNKKLVLDVGLGTNRVAGQNPAAIFSADNQTLESSNLTTSDEQFKTLATVVGQGQGALRPVQNVFLGGIEPQDMARYEIFDNESSLSATADLTARGGAVLGQYQYQNTITGTFLAQSTLTYLTDYDLGDYVTLQAYTYQQNAQITMIEEDWANASYAIKPTFNKSPATITDQVATSTGNMGASVSKLGTTQIITQYNSGSPQTVTMTSAFPNPVPGIEYILENLGSGLVTVVFDGSGNNATLRQNTMAGFIWNGSAWFPCTQISGTNGTYFWAKYPDRKLRQWGNTLTAPGGGTAITYPMTFATIESAFATLWVSSNFAAWASTPGLSGGTLYQSAAGSQIVGWEVIGTY